MSANRAAQYVAVRIQVRWGECDPAGIAFYPRFFEWMDMISHLLARELGVSGDDVLSPTWQGLLPLVAAQAEFLAPARLYDTLEVRAWVTRIGRTSFGLRHEILRVGDGEVLARGREERVHVSRDADGALRPRELSQQMRAALARYGDPEARQPPRR
jgi:4-hydroxybenzoyl-CoA thioesterase